MDSTETGIGRFARAASFAAQKHSTQRRKDAEASPYINHPLALATLLANEGGVEDVDVLCAAVLHDTIEDTATTAAELAARFGAEVAAVVVEVTDDKTLPKLQRKQLQIEHAPHLSRPAKLVKLADKLCNLRDIIEAPPANWALERRAAYVTWTRDVVAGLRGTCPPLEAAFDAAHARWVTSAADG